MKNINKKRLVLDKYGINGSKKKVGINFWRFYFSAINQQTNALQPFLVELEFLNSWESPIEPVLGYTPRVNVTSEDLQAALTGSFAEQNLKGETILTPSYVAVRIGKLGKNGRQLCKYLSINDLNFLQKPFEISDGSIKFSEDELKGSLNVSNEDSQNHPEFMCDAGSCNWNLKYKISKECISGYSKGGDKWYPSGLKAVFEGFVTFDDVQYKVVSTKSNGYIDRLWGKTLPETWFQISSGTLTSLITGKQLYNSGFSAVGIFNERVSLVCNFEENEISFCAEESDRSYSVIWDCSQLPDNDEGEPKLHWSLSITSKLWVIDIDLFCKVNELYSRHLELPEGQRKVLSVVQGGTAVGEIKLYKKNRNNLEQIEHASIAAAFCEFGHKENNID